METITRTDKRGRTLYVQSFNGKEYKLYPGERYFSRGCKRLHREVWKSYYGDIPKGYHVHHKDENTWNNEIENLELVKGSEHVRIHAEEHKKDPNFIRRVKANLDYARTFANEWHKSDGGREWHSKWLKNKPRISSQGNLSVNGVEKNLNLNQMDQIGSVPTSVKQLSAIIRVLTTKLESVKRVARNLFATNTVVPNIAVESVAGNITQTLKKESDLTPKIKSSSVKSAVRNTTADQQGKIDIVAKNAVLNLKWKRERAKYAESNSERENIQKRGFVASNVLADITVLGESTERVYDLEVEGMHEYFANGILVHNCIDAARYYTIGKLLGKVLLSRSYSKEDLGIY